MTRSTLVLFLCGGLLAANLSLLHGGEDGKTGFHHKIHKDKDGTSKYVVFVPKSSKGKKELPVILFLHGSG